jgi:hypothetical protein
MTNLALWALEQTETEELLEVSHPGYKEARDEWAKILANEDHPALDRLDHLHGTYISAFMTAGFALGFATASRFIQEGKP